MGKNGSPMFSPLTTAKQVSQDACVTQDLAWPTAAKARQGACGGGRPKGAMAFNAANSKP